jgi:hypothetical protein
MMYVLARHEGESIIMRAELVNPVTGGDTK